MCIFLPLSAIWAGLISSDASVGARGADCHQRLLRDQFYKSSNKGSTVGSESSRTREKGSISTYTSSAKDPESPTSGFNPHGTDHARSDAIYVGREYTIESGEASKAL
jgi:pheromone alpha factor receptor